MTNILGTSKFSLSFNGNTISPEISRCGKPKESYLTPDQEVKVAPDGSETVIFYGYKHEFEYVVVDVTKAEWIAGYLQLMQLDRDTPITLTPHITDNPDTSYVVNLINFTYTNMNDKFFHAMISMKFRTADYEIIQPIPDVFEDSYNDGANLGGETYDDGVNSGDVILEA